jgi:hypothetical protein
MGSNLTSDGNYKKEQDPGLIKMLKGELINKGSINIQIQLLQEELLEIKRSNAELDDAFKRMAVKRLSLQPRLSMLTLLRDLLSLFLQDLKLKSTAIFCKMKGHTEDYW